MKKNVYWVVLCTVFIALVIVFWNQRINLRQTDDSTESGEGQNPESISPDDTEVSGGQDSEPEEVPGASGDTMPSKTDILIGDDYYVALCENGSVWSWGDNESKKLGVDADRVEDPQRVGIPDRVIKIRDCGWNIWALTEAGYVYIWGKAYIREGKLYEKLQDIVTPVRLENIPLVEDLNAENDHAAVLARNGELYLYGVIRYIQELPVGTTEIILDSVPEEYRELMTNVKDMEIGAGRNHYFIREDGTVFSLMTRDAVIEEGYGLILPNGNDKQKNITYYWLGELADENDNIKVLDGDLRSYFQIIYYECENLTGVDGISADDYTMFLSKEDGTLWYWMSDRVKYHKRTWLTSHADDGMEHGEGRFVPVDIAEIMGIQEGEPVPRIMDMFSNAENTLFLTSDGKLFVSSYVTDHVEDVEYYVKFNAEPKRLPAVEVSRDLPIKRIEFRQLEYQNIIRINGDGKNNFSAIDSKGNYYHITTTK